MFCNILKFKKYLGIVIKFEDFFFFNGVIWFNIYWLFLGC